MEEQTAPQSMFQHAMKSGLIMGGVSIALTAVVYAIDYSILANWKFGIGIIVLTLGATIYTGINYRNQAGGFIAYGKAFQHGLVFMAVAGFISTLFMIVLYTAIDTELPQKLTDVSVEQARAMMEGFGMPEDQLDQAMEDAKKRSEGQFGAMGAIKGYGFGIIFYAIISLITSLFVRKNNPEEAV